MFNRKTLTVLLLVLFVVSVTATAVNAEANAAASCSTISKIVSASGCTHKIQCSSEGSEGDEFLWTFGDGKSINSENPSHTYKIQPTCKIHSVKLTVTDTTDDTEDTAVVKI